MSPGCSKKSCRRRRCRLAKGHRHLWQGKRLDYSSLPFPGHQWLVDLEVDLEASKTSKSWRLAPNLCMTLSAIYQSVGFGHHGQDDDALRALISLRRLSRLSTGAYHPFGMSRILCLLLHLTKSRLKAFEGPRLSTRFGGDSFPSAWSSGEL